ncbi:hypothetical protein K227x_60210 [Rubripirellula lacrimiformis]|uniref:Uncharacterized protein n=1 Tax=Rubripirellula lacrimiformis TaxID=1930273 RepID=A0A517NKM3_9BACT|nr:hypothetical protein [Rubripirellula lacrimiformis]QDT07593.1 hypothetical protein K227x_60210 [Rubripirellula lacrimiformis]
MIDLGESRVLLLEQLESRCMLAGDVLSQSTVADHPDVLCMDQSISQAVAVATSGTSQLQVQTLADQLRFDRSPMDQLRMGGSPTGSAPDSGPQDHGQLNYRQSLGGAQNGMRHPARGQMRQDANPQQQTLVGLIFTPLPPALSPTSQSSTNSPPANSTSTNSSVGSQAAANPRSNLDAADHVVGSDQSLSDAGSDELVTQNRRAENGTDLNVQSAAAVQVDGVGRGAVSALDVATQQAVPNAIANSETIPYAAMSDRTLDQSIESDGGTIEIVPLSPYQHNLQETPSDELPWQIDRASLQRIREATRQSGDPTDENKQDSIDSAIASWFGNSTGLIDDVHCNQDLPSSLQEVSPSMVDVVLEATVGLHRRVNLVQDTNVDPQPNQVRDAILAAIAAEQGSLVDPIAQPNQVRLSGVAYSGAAIVAGAMAAAGRQRKRSKLESTTR